MKTYILIIVISFIADQLLQLKSIRQIKHKDTIALTLHVSMWSIVMSVFTGILLPKCSIQGIVMWWLTITVIHFIVEWACLRMWTHFFYDKKKSLMVFWILLEQLILNVSMLWLFDYLVL
jgi:hypothetical protein